MSKEKICDEMKINKVFKYINVYTKQVKNWPMTILFLIGIKRETKYNLKNIGTVKINRKDIETNLLGILISLSFEKFTDIQKKKIHLLLNQRNDKILEIDGVKILNYELGFIIENFILEQFNVEQGDWQKSIIDIGSNIGDTPLYFANKGYKVLGFEPVKESFEKALYNINLNKNLSEHIEIVNKAVSCKNGKTKIYVNEDLNKGSGDSSQYLKNKDKFEIVDTTTIKKIIEDYDIIPYILKIDCEGCEVDIILNSDLSMFQEIYFEYHTIFTNIPVGTLINKLKSQGFKLIEKTEMVNHLGLGLVKMVKNDKNR